MEGAPQSSLFLNLFNGPYFMRNRRGNTIEFVLSIWILIIFIALPVIDLIGVGIGYSTALYTVHQCSTAASSQRVYEQARDVVQNTSLGLLNSALCKFAKMIPVGGLINSGADLYVDATEVATGRVTTYGPNVPVPRAQVDPATTVYEYRVQSCFDVGPLLSMGSLPFFSYVPGLGTPARINVSSHRTADYADGVAGEAAGALALTSGSHQTTPQTPLNGSGGGGAGDSPTVLGDWNYPEIYNKIYEAGQEVVAEDVLQVPATSDWVGTSINAAAGESLWVDMRSEGLWSDSPGAAPYDADGRSQTVSMQYVISHGLTGWTDNGNGTATKSFGAMLGRMGLSGTPFTLGKLRTNFKPPGTGTFFLRIDDDDRADNTGIQTVRVVLTRPKRN